jgi:ABC-type branched-subunit amino acid transport system substrate-binding protein
MNDFEIAAAPGARHSPPPQRHALEMSMALSTVSICASEIRAYQTRTSRFTCAALAALAVTLTALPAMAQERTLKIYGFGAKSGVVRIFGLNSEAAMKAAAEQINKAGGVTLGDGAKAKLVIEYLDDRCNAEEGINALRRIASQNDSVVAVAPTCSNVAEPVFGILQKKAGDATDSGLQFPLYTDVAAKGGLASMSQWAFRNVPSESNMYKAMFEWMKLELIRFRGHLVRQNGTVLNALTALSALSRAYRVCRA